MRTYLRVWDRYRDGPLGGALREVLEDGFEHEDATVAAEAERFPSASGLSSSASTTSSSRSSAP